MKTIALQWAVGAALVGSLALLWGDRSPLESVSADGEDSRHPPMGVLRSSLLRSSLVRIDDNHLVYSVGHNRLLLLACDAKAQTLEVKAAFEISEDTERFALAPDKRNLAGYYADNLATKRLEATEAAKAAFVAEASKKLDVGLASRERLAQLAEAYWQTGDASFLVTQLTAERYAVRRAAALTLGDAGFVAASPVLIEVMTEQSPQGKRALELLERFAGTPLTTGLQANSWWKNLPTADRQRRVSLDVAPQ